MNRREFLKASIAGVLGVVTPSFSAKEGKIIQARIYNYALTEQEIAKIYSEPNTWHKAVGVFSSCNRQVYINRR